MFMIGKRPLTQTEKDQQALRFAKKIVNKKRDNANIISAMRLKMKG